MKLRRDYFSRAQCESCGAPLSKTRQRGKYVCQYCGAVYYREADPGDSWEEEQEEVEINAEGLAQNTFVSSRPKPGLTFWLLLTSGFILAGCFVLALLGGWLTAKDYSKTQTAAETIVKPSMLTVLPAAEEAGTEVAYGDWALYVDPQIEISQDGLSFIFSLTNWQDRQRVLQYIVKTIIVYDDLGNTYPFHSGNCAVDLAYFDRQVIFEPYEEVSFQSSSGWCKSENSIPVYSGIIPVNARHLYLHFDKFGVFENITFVFDL